MPSFILATRLQPHALHQPRSFTALEHHVAEQVHQHCPEVKWLHSWAVLGHWDYLDVIEAPDLDTAARVSILVRSYGQAHTEVWPAMPWSAFKAMIAALAPSASSASSTPSAPSSRSARSAP